MPRFSCYLVLVCLDLVIVLSTISGACAEDDHSFERSVAPIFRAHCVRCHNDQKRRGELSLQSRASLLAGGEIGDVVVPGDPGSSYLLDLITPVDGTAEMPQGAPPLSAEERAAVRRWIKDGAPWPSETVIELPQWWSLRPVRRPALPELSAARRDWTRNPIDMFIAARHAEHDFTPAAETDRRTWLRRVTFDMIGLPPTATEQEAFRNDTTPLAWEAAVDRLLASPAYGERWARHWLDVVRFSESNGFEEDAPRPHAWPYRDYVIRSLNADKPYDLFVREQLAGDVLLPVTHDGIEATGFLVAGPWDHAAAVAASPTEKLRAREVLMDEMLAAISQTFLGLTVNCARCHDHKFDPIPQTDYYALKAVFEGVDQADGSGREASLVMTPDERRAFEQRAAELQTEIDQQRRAFQQIERQRTALLDDQNLPPLNRAVALWQFADNAGAEGTSTANDLKGASHLAGKWSLQFGQTIEQPIAAVNSDQHVLNTGAGVLLKNELGGAGYAIIPNLAGSELLPRPQTSLTLFARVRFTEPFHGVDDIFRIGSSPSEHRDTAGLEFLAMDGVADEDRHRVARPRFVTLGQGLQQEATVVYPHPVQTNHWVDITGVFTSLPETSSGRMTLYVADPNRGRQLGAAATLEVPYDTLESSGVQNLLFFVAPGFRNGAQPYAQMDLAAIWHEALSPSDVEALSATEPQVRDADEDSRRRRDAQLKSLQSSSATLEERIKRLETTLKQHRDSPRKAFIGIRRPPPPTVLFLRGDIGLPGPAVAPAALSAIQVPARELIRNDDASDAERRREFAKWLTHDAHPLTARVIVNRLWHYHFGRGLVDTPSDFGASGSLPSHPALLDWLASELVAHDWSLKHLHRLILTSATYRMRSDQRTAGENVAEAGVDPAARDAENRFLWHFPWRRLEAETVRDAMLAVSGELNRQMYGPSMQPFEVTRFNTYFYTLFDRDEPAYNRRTVYRMNVNTGRDPLLDALDCPAPSVMTPVRRETTTPLQALALMNDPFVLRQAARVAQRIDRLAALRGQPGAGQPAGRRARIALAWSEVLGRDATEPEMAMADRLVVEADLPTLCWTLLNSSEFLFVK